MSDDDIIQEIITHMGKFTDIWGMGMLPGELWALMYFYGPQTQVQLKEKLHCSLGSISEALSKLENWGVVSIVGKDGRKNIYQADFSQKKKFRSMCDLTLHMHINPMIDIISTKSNNIRNKELKDKVDMLKLKYSKGSSKLKLLLKFLGK